MAQAMKKYPNPPIQEAVIEIKFNPNDLVNVDTIKDLAGSIDDELKIWGQNIQIHTQSDSHGKQEQQRVVGFALKDEASRRSLHLDLDRIAYTLLGGYDCWTAFEKRFMEYWHKLRSILGSDVQIRRIGVRFINKINLQLADPNEAEEYTLGNFDAYSSSGKASVEMQEKLLRTILSFDDLRCTLVKVLRKDKETNKFNLMLDIDVFQSLDEVLDDQALESALRRLRILKNEVFESNITEKTRGLFQ